MIDILPIEDRARLTRSFMQHVPHNNALGITIEALDDARAVLRLPWAEHLVGDPSTGVLHGGAVTALLDAASGSAVFMALWQPVPVATLDLRIDYLRSAASGHDLIATATVERVTRSVAFSRCVAAHADDPSVVVAIGTGSFMLSTKRGTRRLLPESAP